MPFPRKGSQSNSFFFVELATTPIPAYTVRRPARVSSIFTGRIGHAGVAELVDAPDSKSGFFGSGGSIPPLGTMSETAM
jgi:hypothetical protein